MRIIAGPCVHEDYNLSNDIASHCQEVCDKYEIDYYFKASFDKANRSHYDSYRGIGLDNFIYDMNAIESKKVTDVHETWQIPKLEWLIDVIQIPAFLCRQTDLIIEACKTDCIVNIKKGQFLSPQDCDNILSKCEGAKEVWITERGTSFGYNNLVVDYSGLVWMLTHLGCPIVFDATHSAQKPGGLGNRSGGDSSVVPSLVRAASSVGVQNFFVETHPDPEKSPSDGPNMIKLENFDELVEQIIDYNYIQPLHYH